MERSDSGVLSRASGALSASFEERNRAKEGATSGFGEEGLEESTIVAFISDHGFR